MKTLKEILFYKEKEPIDEDGRRLRLYHTIYIYACLVILAVGIGIVSLFLASPYLGYSGNAMFVSYFKVPLLLALNFVPVVLLVLLMYFISGRAWVSFTVSAVLVIGGALVNYYKLRLRSDPFYASDFVFFSEAGNIVSNYTIEITSRVVLSCICVVLGIVFAAVFMRGALKNWKVRLTGALAVLLVAGALYPTVYTSEAVYEAADNSGKINIWSEMQVYVSKGFVYPFIHSIPDAIETPPEGYNEEAAIASLAAYETADIPENQKVNIISIMLEAYADLSEFDEIEFNKDVYGPLYKLQEESISGSLISNVFAGGTIDTERAFLTGYTKSEEYRNFLNSYVYYLKSQGYTAEGVHAGDGWFYNRLNVNRYLGFDNYYFLEDYENGSRADAFFFGEVTNLYASRDREQPYFSYSLSYQNHGAYDTETTVDTAYIRRGDMSEESYNILNNYLSGVSDTTARLYDFVTQFKADSAPVVIVVFGDHMPWLGNGNSVYAELGIDIDVSKAPGFYNYYSTPYLIWANDAAKAVLGSDFVGQGETMSACFLMGEVFRLCGWEGPAYMQLMDDLRGYTPIVNTGTGFFLENGALTTELSNTAREIADIQENVQYYMKHNFAY